MRQTARRDFLRGGLAAAAIACQGTTRRAISCQGDDRDAPDVRSSNDAGQNDPGQNDSGQSDASNAESGTRPTVAWFLIGDTHYFAVESSTSELDPRSDAACKGLIETLNLLPGTELPESVGGGHVAHVQGVIHAGDIIDTGDKRGGVRESMQRTEWDHYAADFGLTGTEGRLRFPIYEVYGNHDSPSGEGLVIEALAERNRRRPNSSVSPNGLHFSWDWDSLHCVNLGIVVGQDRTNPQRRRYNPMESLEFLIGDLKERVGESGRPILITHHIDIVRYNKPCDATNEANLGMEWNPCDVAAYHEAIRGYNVIAIQYGHTHVRNILRWNGKPEKSSDGIPLLNVDNGSHFSSGNQAFFYIELHGQTLHVRECATKDSWASLQWTPQVWKLPSAVS